MKTRSAVLRHACVFVALFPTFANASLFTSGNTFVLGLGFTLSNPSLSVADRVFVTNPVANIVSSGPELQVQIVNIGWTLKDRFVGLLDPATESIQEPNGFTDPNWNFQVGISPIGGSDDFLVDLTVDGSQPGSAVVETRSGVSDSSTNADSGLPAEAEITTEDILLDIQDLKLSLANLPTGGPIVGVAEESGNTLGGTTATFGNDASGGNVTISRADPITMPTTGDSGGTATYRVSVEQKQDAASEPLALQASLAVIPEPAIPALLGIGLVGLGFSRRRVKSVG